MRSKVVENFEDHGDLQPVQGPGGNNLAGDALFSRKSAKCENTFYVRRPRDRHNES